MPLDLTTIHWLGTLLFAWLVIIVVAQILGLVFKSFKQPPVMGEVAGGILLGPSFLGLFFPHIQEFIFPPAIVPWIGWFAQLGIVLYMFLVGLELDWTGLKGSGKSTLAISLASILFPFVLGLAFAGCADATLAGPAVNPVTYALFVGVSMSVTAFPVLARILSATGLRRTPMGNLALACAALNDVAAWCLLALVIALAQARISHGIGTLGLAAIYLAAMFGAVRPLLRSAHLHPAAVVLGLLALSAFVTHWIGIHSIFGAFLLGAIVPKENAFTGRLAVRLEPFVRVILLPAFFAFTGLRTQINLLDSPHDWLLCAAVIALATAGKLGGTAVAARLCGHRWRSAMTLGVLMNTRGLVELIVLNAGFELNLISAKLFAILVVMALTTTVMTCPLLQALKRRENPATARA